MELKSVTVQLNVKGREETHHLHWDDKAKAYISESGTVKVPDPKAKKVQVLVRQDVTKDKWDTFKGQCKADAGNEEICQISNKSRHQQIKQITVRFAPTAKAAETGRGLFADYQYTGTKLQDLVTDWVEKKVASGDLPPPPAKHIDTLKKQMKGFTVALTQNELREVLAVYAIRQRKTLGDMKPLFKPAPRPPTEHIVPIPPKPQKPIKVSAEIAKAKTAQDQLDRAIRRLDKSGPKALIADLLVMFLEIDRAGEKVWAVMQQLRKSKDSAAAAAVKDLEVARRKYNEAEKRLFTLLQQQVETTTIAGLESAHTKIVDIAKKGPSAAADLRNAKRDFREKAALASKMITNVGKAMVLPGEKSSPRADAILARLKDIDALQNQVDDIAYATGPSATPLPDGANRVFEGAKKLLQSIQAQRTKAGATTLPLKQSVALVRDLIRLEKTLADAMKAVGDIKHPDAQVLAEQLADAKKQYPELLGKAEVLLKAGIEKNIQDIQAEQQNVNNLSIKRPPDRAAFGKAKQALLQQIKGVLGTMEGVAKEVPSLARELRGKTDEMNKLQAAVRETETQLLDRDLYNKIYSIQWYTVQIRNVMQHVPTGKSADGGRFDKTKMDHAFAKGRLAAVHRVVQHLAEVKTRIDEIKKQQRDKLNKMLEPHERAYAQFREQAKIAQAYLVQELDGLTEQVLDKNSYTNRLLDPKKRDEMVKAAERTRNYLLALLGPGDWTAVQLLVGDGREAKIDRYRDALKTAKEILTDASFVQKQGKLPEAMATVEAAKRAAETDTEPENVKKYREQADSVLKKVHDVYCQLFRCRPPSTKGSRVGVEDESIASLNRELPIGSIYKDQEAFLARDIAAARKLLDGFTKMEADELSKDLPASIRTKIERTNDRIMLAFLKLQKAEGAFKRLEGKGIARPSLTVAQKATQRQAITVYTRTKGSLATETRRARDTYNEFFDAFHAPKAVSLNNEQIAKRQSLVDAQIAKLDAIALADATWSALPPTMQREWDGLLVTRSEAVELLTRVSKRLLDLNTDLDKAAKDKAATKPEPKPEPAAELPAPATPTAAEQRRQAAEDKKIAAAAEKAKSDAVIQEITRLKERRSVIETELSRAGSFEKLDDLDAEITRAIKQLADYKTNFADSVKGGYEGLQKRIPALRDKIRAAEKRDGLERDLKKVSDTANQLIAEAGKASEITVLRAILVKLNTVKSDLEKMRDGPLVAEGALKSRASDQLIKIQAQIGTVSDKIRTLEVLADANKPAAVDALDKKAKALIREYSGLRKKQDTKSMERLKSIHDELSNIEKELDKIEKTVPSKDALKDRISNLQIAILAEAEKIAEITGTLKPAVKPPAQPAPTPEPAPQAVPLPSDHTATAPKTAAPAWDAKIAEHRAVVKEYADDYLTPIKKYTPDAKLGQLHKIRKDIQAMLQSIPKSGFEHEAALRSLDADALVQIMLALKLKSVDVATNTAMPATKRLQLLGVLKEELNTIRAELVKAKGHDDDIESLDRGLEDIEAAERQLKLDVGDQTPAGLAAALSRSLGMSVTVLPSDTGISLSGLDMEQYRAIQARLFGALGKYPTPIQAALIQVPERDTQNISTPMLAAIGIGRKINARVVLDPAMSGSSATLMMYFKKADADAQYQKMTVAITQKKQQDKADVDAAEAKRIAPFKLLQGILPTGGKAMEVREPGKPELYVSHVRVTDSAAALQLIRKVATTLKLDEKDDFFVFAHPSIANGLVNGSPAMDLRGSRIFGLTPATPGEIYIVTRSANAGFSIKHQFGEKEFNLKPYLQKMGAKKNITFSLIVSDTSKHRAQQRAASEAKATQGLGVKVGSDREVAPAAPPPAPAAPKATPATGPIKLPPVHTYEQILDNFVKELFGVGPEQAAVYSGDIEPGSLEKASALKKRISNIMSHAKQLGMGHVLILYRGVLKDTENENFKKFEAIVKQLDPEMKFLRVRQLSQSTPGDKEFDEVRYVLVRDTSLKDDAITRSHEAYLKKQMDLSH